MIKIYIACDSYSYHYNHIAASTSKECLIDFIEEQVTKGEFEEGQLQILVADIADGITIFDD